MVWNKFKSKKQSSFQLELPLKRAYEPDRNFKDGGRSFYFFDFDDNIAFLSTPIFVFHKETGAELSLSSHEFAQHSQWIGEKGPYKDYQVNLCDHTGSFRRFRDQEFSLVEKFMGRKQKFVDDLAEALGFADFQWKGPSWNCFYHAVYNKRPISLITARGHHPNTIQSGLNLLAKEGHLPHRPNLFAIFPVSHPDIRKNLGLSPNARTPEAKQKAIRRSVELAVKKYGMGPHRFGMSDDDPQNVQWITDEMTALKREFPQMSFFVIETSNGKMLKREVFADYTEDEVLDIPSQLSFFGTP